jgi:hypothetical protein
MILCLSVLLVAFVGLCHSSLLGHRLPLVSLSLIKHSSALSTGATPVPKSLHNESLSVSAMEKIDKLPHTSSSLNCTNGVCTIPLRGGADLPQKSDTFADQVMAEWLSAEESSSPEVPNKSDDSSMHMLKGNKKDSDSGVIAQSDKPTTSDKLFSVEADPGSVGLVQAQVAASGKSQSSTEAQIETSATSATLEFQADPAHVAALVGMGYSASEASTALQAARNDVGLATEALQLHDDAADAFNAAMRHLMAAGWEDEAAALALRASGGNVTASELLLAKEENATLTQFNSAVRDMVCALLVIVFVTLYTFMCLPLE